MTNTHSHNKHQMTLLQQQYNICQFPRPSNKTHYNMIHNLKVIVILLQSYSEKGLFRISSDQSRCRTEMDCIMRKISSTNVIPGIQYLMTETESASNDNSWPGNAWSTTVEIENGTKSWNNTESTTTSTADIYATLELYSQYRWAQYVGTYTHPLQFILGTIGNILSVLVMTRKSMIKSSTCFYMAVLAVVDTLVLYSACFRAWLVYINGYDLLNSTSTACKTISFFCYWSFSMSAWILVAMTIDRYVVIHYPLKVNKYATIVRAQKVIILLIILLIGFNIHYLFTVGINNYGNCAAIKDHKKAFIELIWPWLDATVYSFLPFIILVVFNSLIIYDHHKAVIRRTSLQPSFNNRSVTRRISLKTHGNKRLTVMLLFVSFSFLITSSPKTIIVILRPYFEFIEEGMHINYDLVAAYTLSSVISDFLMYTNHSLNFFLYCMSGKKFREELKRLLLQCCKRNGNRHTSAVSIVSNNRRSSTINKMFLNDKIERNNCDTESTYL